MKKKRLHIYLDLQDLKKVKAFVEEWNKTPGSKPTTCSDIISYLINERLEDPLESLLTKAEELGKEQRTVEIRIQQIRYKRALITQQQFEKILRSWGTPESKIKELTKK